MRKKFFSLTGNRRAIEYAPMFLIILLLVCQIIVSYVVAYRQSIENHTSNLTQVMQLQLSVEESHKASLASFAATIAADTDVLRILNKEPYSYLDLSTICMRIRKYLSLSSPSSNAYIYSKKLGIVYDSYANTYRLSSSDITVITDAISAFEKDGVTDFFDNSYSYKIFLADIKTGDLIIIREDIHNMSQSYVNLQRDSKSNLLVTDKNGFVIYGADEYTPSSDISEKGIFLARTIEKPYQIITHKKQAYIACYAYSDFLERWYIMFTPTSSIVQNSFSNQNYIYTYICIFLSFLILIRVLSLWKKFRLIVINSKMFSHAKSNEKDNAIALHNLISSDSAENVQKLKAHLSSYDTNYTYIAVMLAKIDNADTLIEEYSASDLELIKYGMDNICTEIFEKYTLKLIPVYDSDNTLEYILCSYGSSGEFFRQAAEECMNALYSYIQMQVSFFVGSFDTIENISSSFEGAYNASEYSFIRGTNIIMTADSLTQISYEDFSKAKALCDDIKANIINACDDYNENIRELKSLCSQMNSSQIREILYYLLISLYSATEHIKNTQNTIIIFDVTGNFLLLETAKHCDEIFKVADNLFAEVKNLILSNKNSYSSQFVLDCMNIIEECYPDETLCLEEIAHRLNFSANYLGRKFKQLTGTSISNKITEIRLEKAADEIINTNDKIQDIIKRVGFINSSHFTALFRKKFGESPINYRRNHKN